MSENFSPALRRELLDDFYAECDELLIALREGLSHLESTVGTGEPKTKIIERLFRNAHSFKGNLAIVGLRSAEELAHSMEDLLRAVSKDRVLITASLVDELLAAAQRLEQIVGAYRLSKSLPETQDLLDHFRRYVAAPSVPETVSAPATPHEAPPAQDSLAATRSRGLLIFRASFSPSAASDQRGVNVSAVRKRLASVSEIISTTPKVGENKAIVFEFILGLREMPTDLAAWALDGVIFEAVPAPENETATRTISQPLAPATGSVETLSLTPSHMVRVDLSRLDELMRIAGEMVIQRSRLDERIKQMGDDHFGLKEVNLAFSRSLREMREAITRVRMVPIGELFTRMPFVVRELMRGSAKKVRVVLLGSQTEVDKFLVERLKEPILHLVRNAFAHGVEPAETRVAAGKQEEATITLEAKSVSELVVIQIRDDGCGVDSPAVAARAATLGLPLPAQLDAAAILNVLCASGFSTQDEADLASGRGMGMAVVANTVRELDGSLALETVPGQGSCFTLKLPLNVSIADAIIVSVGKETCAVPQSCVNEIIQVPITEVRTVSQNEVVPYRDGLLPVVRLQSMFKTAKSTQPLLTLLVVASERGVVGLVVDRLISQREIVIRPLIDPLLQVPGISGATELGDGRAILILDPSALTQGITRPLDFLSSEPAPSQARAS